MAKDLASKVSKREGLKSQTSIGNIREIIRILPEVFAEERLKSKRGVSRSLMAFIDKTTKIERKLKKQKKLKKLRGGKK